MKAIMWKVVINDDQQIASMEHAQGFTQDSVESHLMIMGILDNLKQKHQDKLKTLFAKTKKVKTINGVEVIEERDEGDVNDI